MDYRKLRDEIAPVYSIFDFDVQVTVAAQRRDRKYASRKRFKMIAAQRIARN